MNQLSTLTGPAIQTGSVMIRTTGWFSQDTLIGISGTGFRTIEAAQAVNQSIVQTISGSIDDLVLFYYYKIQKYQSLRSKN